MLFGGSQKTLPDHCFATSPDEFLQSHAYAEILGSGKVPLLLVLTPDFCVRLHGKGARTRRQHLQVSRVGHCAKQARPVPGKSKRTLRN